MSGETVTAYYNEFDPAAAQVLRALIDAGVIAPGVVDTRSIKDVSPDDLKGFTQCHFFAGGGLWSVAARMAGWPDNRPIWTGSCPCQPFSVAGKGAGAHDHRHLWPDFFGLIRAARPPVVVGEQVAGAAGYGWFDGVAADLEGEGYAARAVDIPACAVDAPHIRQRLYWCAVADSGHQSRRPRSIDAQDRAFCSKLHGSNAVQHAAGLGRGAGRAEHGVRGGRGAAAGADAQGGLGDANGERLPIGASERTISQDAGCLTEGEAFGRSSHKGCNGNLADTDNAGRLSGERNDPAARHRHPLGAADGRNGSFWADAGWIACHDGKARRAKPGLRLLVDGFPGRVDLWRIAGNAIVPQLAAEVLGALMDVLPDWRHDHA